MFTCLLGALRKLTSKTQSSQCFLPSIGKIVLESLLEVLVIYWIGGLLCDAHDCKNTSLICEKSPFCRVVCLVIPYITVVSKNESESRPWGREFHNDVRSCQNGHTEGKSCLHQETIKYPRGIGLWMGILMFHGSLHMSPRSYLKKSWHHWIFCTQ